MYDNATWQVRSNINKSQIESSCYCPCMFNASLEDSIGSVHSIFLEEMPPSQWISVSSVYKSMFSKLENVQTH